MEKLLQKFSHSLNFGSVSGVQNLILKTFFVSFLFYFSLSLAAPLNKVLSKYFGSYTESVYVKCDLLVFPSHSQLYSLATAHSFLLLADEDQCAAKK